VLGPRHLSKTWLAGCCYRLDLKYFVSSKKWQLTRLKVPYNGPRGPLAHLPAPARAVILRLRGSAREFVSHGYQ
jgi:hypothetical protein